MKKIGIVTVNYNSEKETKDLLTSLERIDKKNLDIKIYIVDNASKKPFKIVHDNIEVIRSDENTGFAGGYNIGIRKALSEGHEYVLIINNDTKVYSDMIIRLVTCIEKYPDAGAVVPKIYFAKGHEYHKSKYKASELGKVIWYAGGYTDWKNVKSIHRGVDEVDRGQYEKQEPVEFATGCCILFKREVLEKAGLFDERYFLYYEDADLSERIKRAGYKIYYDPHACLIHVNAASSGGPGNTLHDYFLTRNQMLFGMTYAPLRTKFALVRQAIRLLLTGRKFQKRGIRDYFARSLGKGTYFNG